MTDGANQGAGGNNRGGLLEKEGTKIATRTRRRPAAGEVMGRVGLAAEEPPESTPNRPAHQVMVRGGGGGRVPADRKCRWPRFDEGKSGRSSQCWPQCWLQWPLVTVVTPPSSLSGWMGRKMKRDVGCWDPFWVFLSCWRCGYPRRLDSYLRRNLK